MLPHGSIADHKLQQLLSITAQVSRNTRFVPQKKQCRRTFIRGTDPVVVPGLDGLRVDVWADEAIFTNVGLRSGTRRFHNILFIGKQVTDPLSWTVGVGPHINLSKSVYLEPDLIYQTIANFSNLNDNSHITKIRVLGGWEISKAVSIFGGPTLNSFYSTSNDGSDYALLTIRESESGGKWKRTSIGFVFGAKFL